MGEFKKYDGAENLIMRGDGYYVSFHPGPFGADDGAETALYVDGSYYILNGDYRKQYMGASTLAECMGIFQDNIANISSWSSVCGQPTN